MAPVCVTVACMLYLQGTHTIWQTQDKLYSTWLCISGLILGLISPTYFAKWAYFGLGFQVASLSHHTHIQALQAVMPASPTACLWNVETLRHWGNTQNPHREFRQATNSQCSRCKATVPAEPSHQPEREH